MQRHGISLILVAIGLLAGCAKDASDPGPNVLADTTICKLLMLSYKTPSLPDYDYTVRFTYDNTGKLDSTMVNWIDVHTAIKYHYSVYDQPDSLSVIFTYPPNLQGSGYRIYFGYDSDRRQILTARANGDSMRYTYNSHGQLIRKIHEYPSGGVQKFDTVLFLYPNNTTHNYNRATISYHPGGFDGDTTRYTYDNHLLPLKFPLGSPFPSSFQPETDNNLHEARSMCCGVEFVYTYNSAGYPATQAFMPGAFSTTTYTYHCETIP